MRLLTAANAEDGHAGGKRSLHVPIEDTNDLFRMPAEIVVAVPEALFGVPDPSPARPGAVRGACPKSVGPIPAVLGQRGEGAQTEEQETTDDGHESHRNRIETAGG